MRIVVISDTHLCGRIDKFPGSLLEDIKSADMVVHTGDFVEEGCLKSLEAVAKELKAVHGNMDSEELKNKLPDKEIFKVGNYKIAVTHGSGAPGNIPEALAEVFKAEHPDLIIFGHSHAAFNQKIKDTIFFNSGSLFDKIYSKYNSYGIIEINDKIEAKIVKI